MIKVSIPVLILLSALFSIGCSGDKSTNENLPVEQELNTLLNSYYRTMTRRDWKAYREFFWDKAIITTVWQKEGDEEEVVHTTTINEFIAQTHLGPDSQPIFEEKPIDIKITVKNDLAQAWVTYEAKFGSEENLMKWKGMDLFSLLKHNERWRIVSLTFSSKDNP